MGKQVKNELIVETDCLTVVAESFLAFVPKKESPKKPDGKGVHSLSGSSDYDHGQTVKFVMEIYLDGSQGSD
jgi:hypothetical protein